MLCKISTNNYNLHFKNFTRGMHVLSVCAWESFLVKLSLGNKTRRCVSVYLGVVVLQVWYFEHALLQLKNCHHILPEKTNPLLHLFAEPHSHQHRNWRQKRRSVMLQKPRSSVCTCRRIWQGWRKSPYSTYHQHRNWRQRRRIVSLPKARKHISSLIGSLVKHSNLRKNAYFSRKQR